MMHEEKSKADIAKEQLAKIMNSQKTKDVLTKMATDPMFRMGVSAGSAGALGIVTGLFDDEEDTMLSLLGKGVAMAAIEAATEELFVMGGQTYLKNYGLPSGVAGKIGEKIGVPQKFQPLAKAGIKEASKRLTPDINKGKLVTTGIGAAAGLLWSVVSNKDESMKETGMNMLVGSGVALIGKEIFEHWDSSKNGKTESGLAKQLKKLGGTGDLAKDLKDVMNDPQKYLSNLPKTDYLGPSGVETVMKELEGTPLKRIADDLPKNIKEILDGDVGKELKPLLAEQGVDWDNFRASVDEKVQAFHQEINANKQQQDKTVTVAKEQTKDIKAKSTDPKIFMETEKKKADRIAKGLKIGGIAAAVAIGAGTVLDVGNDLRKEKETERMKRKQEKELQRKQGREDKIMQQNNYSYVDFGMIVQELFDDRIGHYKMGNSKFY